MVIDVLKKGNKKALAINEITKALA